MGTCQSKINEAEQPSEVTKPVRKLSLESLKVSTNERKIAPFNTDNVSSKSNSSNSSTGSNKDKNGWSESETSQHKPRRKYEKRSSVGLDEMIENLKEVGALTSNVVNIEVPFGKPIEEVYDGVHTGDILGSGVSGLVRKVTHRATGIQYAVKCLDLGLLETEESLEQLRQEIFIMCQLDHPNIVRLEEVYESENEIYLVQELCHGRELFDRLDEQPDYHYTEQQCARLVKQMLSAVRYIHSKEIIHRDLKLENFLFNNEDASAELKMIDFGLSKHFKYGEVQHEAVGTPYTVAPEVIRGKYDERCDVWAIGVITYLLLSGEPPFGGCGGPEPLSVVRSNILSGSFFFDPPEIWNKVSMEAKDFIKRLLVTDPIKRPTASQAQKSTWLKRWAVQETRINGENLLSPNVVNALVTFKEYSDMRKLLCEVLSFTLVPEQIKELRKEFEKIDVEGSGEISFGALKTVLLESAGSGSLGALTEDEVKDIFNAMRVRKTETKVHWHEFIAAGLSQCKVDDRNLRLAFDRLDKTHKGFINFGDIIDILGCDGNCEETKESYRKIFLDGIQDLRSKDSIITYENFLLLMKGQATEPDNFGAMKLNRRLSSERLITVPESKQIEEEKYGPGRINTEVNEENDENAHPANALLGINLPEHEHDNQQIEDLIHDESKTPLVVNRNLYRAHRQMRLGVLEACKRFEDIELYRLQQEHQQKQTKQIVGGAGLVMVHGHSKKLSTEAIRKILHERQQKQQKLLDKANINSGRGCRRRNLKTKTVSDMSAMMANNVDEPTTPKAQAYRSERHLMTIGEPRSCPASPAIGASRQPVPFIPNLPFLSLSEDEPVNNDGADIPFLSSSRDESTNNKKISTAVTS